VKALSIMQPWASLIAFGHKAIENRTWRPPTSMIGQRFAIHASKKIDMDALTELHHGMCGWKRENWPYAKPKLFPTSAIIATAVLGRVVVGDGFMEPAPDDERAFEEPWRSIAVDQRRWYFGPVGFVLHDVEQFEPIGPVKGALGFWEVGHEAMQTLSAITVRKALNTAPSGEE
jgi:hypothetical protein